MLKVEKSVSYQGKTFDAIPNPITGEISLVFHADNSMYILPKETLSDLDKVIRSVLPKKEYKKKDVITEEASNPIPNLDDELDQVDILPKIKDKK